MQGTPAIYLGRIVSKDNFRVFIYAPDGTQKIVESWEEFQKHMQTGLWFATPDESKVTIEVPAEAPKTRRPRTKKQSGVLDEVKQMLDDETESLALEVTDDFLPKG